jgi:hypothetical protein
LKKTKIPVLVWWFFGKTKTLAPVPNLIPNMGSVQLLLTGTGTCGSTVLTLQGTHPKMVISHVHNTWIIMAEVGHNEPAPTSAS